MAEGLVRLAAFFYRVSIIHVLPYRPSSLKSGFKKPGKNGTNVFRAILITGPPGIGKTTSAHMVAKLEGYTPIELNASDARSKKLVEVSTQIRLRDCTLTPEQSGMNVNNTSLDGYIAGSRVRFTFWWERVSLTVSVQERDGVTITDRTVLIMDEVDGMSSGDRGGVGALNAMIKKSKVCNSFFMLLQAHQDRFR